MATGRIPSCSASVYRWYKDEIGGLEEQEAQKSGRDFHVLMNEKLSVVPAGSRGLLVLPYFAGAATPRYNHLAWATILGLTFSHDRFDLARALIEGLTLDMKDILSSLVRLGVAVVEARLLGGPARSRVWTQIQADVYGIPANTLKVADATVLGAAILGGVGAGIFSSIPSGVDATVHLCDCLEPNPRHVEIYANLYEAYCRAYEGLDCGGVFATLYRARLSMELDKDS